MSVSYTGPVLVNSMCESDLESNSLGASSSRGCFWKRAAFEQVDQIKPTDHC